MRLREIQSMLSEFDKNIHIEIKSTQNSSDKWVFGLQRTINNIEGLSVLGFLDADIQRLKSLGDQIYYARNSNDKIRVDNNVSKSISNSINIVKEKISGFNTLIDNSIPEQHEDVVSIKLPDYDELDDLSKFFKDLNQAMQTGLKIDEIKGKYTLQNFDSGSLWVEIIFYASSTLFFLGKLIDKAQDIQKKSVDIQIAKKQLEKLEIENDSLKETKDALDKNLDDLINDEIESLASDNELSPESINSVKTSIKLFSKLIIDGTRFYPSIKSSEDVKKLFPHISKKLNEPQKLLKEQPPEDSD